MAFCLQGDNFTNQFRLGLGSLESAARPTQIQGFDEHIVQMHCGFDHMAAVTGKDKLCDVVIISCARNRKGLYLGIWRQLPFGTRY